MKNLKRILITVCFLSFLFHTFSFLQFYWTYPVVVNIQTTAPVEFPIPAFTFCNNNGIKPEVFCDMGTRCWHSMYIRTQKVCTLWPTVCERLGNLMPRDFRIDTKKNTSKNLLLMQKGFDCTKTAFWTRRCQLINVEIVFNDFQIRTTTYKPKLERLSLLSSIGGAMGIYLGISMSSLYRLIEFIFNMVPKLQREGGEKKKKIIHTSSSRKEDRFEISRKGYKRTKALPYNDFLRRHDLTPDILQRVKKPVDDFFSCKIISSDGERKCTNDYPLVGSYYSVSDFFGICYTINSRWSQLNKSLEKLRRSDRIEIEFYVDLIDRNRSVPADRVVLPKYNYPTMSAAMQMLLHNNFVSISPYRNGLDLLGGKSYHLKLKQEEKHLLPCPQIDIKPNVNDYITAWNDEAALELKPWMIVEECKYNLSLKEFGCVPYNVDYPHNDSICKLCRGCSDKAKVLDECENLLNSYNQPCDFISYKMALEEKTILIEKEIEPYDKAFNPSEVIIVPRKGYDCAKIAALTRRCQTIQVEISFDDFQITTTTYKPKCQTIQVEISFDDFQITTTTYKPKFESFEILSVIGSYMGLYLGISMFSFSTLLEILLDRILKRMELLHNIFKASHLRLDDGNVHPVILKLNNLSSQKNLTLTGYYGNEAEIRRSSVYERCPFIQRPNITFLGGGSFAGIPEHFIMNLTCCMTILIVFLILKKIAWMQQKTAECEILEVGITFPSVQIEDIKLAYDYQHLISMNAKLRYAEDNLDICRFIKSRQSREVMVLKSGSFLTRILTCREGEKISGAEHYENKVNKYKIAIAEELNRLPKKVLPIAFVTFKHRRDAKLL
ncbi:hypothetical protein HNY73_008798 [Argiope bruennichi]|uniref:CSC1/OSCA1-like cytosolic domain-containing protein n=1 Tax=Argiope bruennichi TaxID=94029 RepID=A0A8T0F7J6_ARGBR|nr:hypothetical protein HNY73_008798 [Argiope bruennichi]